MEWHSIVQAALSLIFVIGLLLLTLWTFKYCELKGLKCRMIRGLTKDQRLEVLEMRRLDAKNTLVLIRCDNREILLLLGSSANMILQEHLPLRGPSVND